MTSAPGAHLAAFDAAAVSALWRLHTCSVGGLVCFTFEVRLAGSSCSGADFQTS